MKRLILTALILVVGSLCTASGAPIEGKSRKLEHDLRLSDVRVDDFVGVIVPCCCKGGVQC